MIIFHLKFSYKISDIFIKNYSTLLILRIISIFMQIVMTFDTIEGSNNRYF